MTEYRKINHILLLIEWQKPQGNIQLLPLPSINDIYQQYPNSDISSPKIPIKLLTLSIFDWITVILPYFNTEGKN